MPNDNPIMPGPGRFIGGIFGFAFAGIGLTVLIFLWGTPLDEFGSPPLFFRVFGSFIAIVFVAVGGGALMSSIKGRTPMDTAAAQLSSMQAALRSRVPEASVTPAAVGYTCPHCGAPLPAKADVSPLGDAKCPFCHTWFNIHQNTR